MSVTDLYKFNRSIKTYGLNQEKVSLFTEPHIVKCLRKCFFFLFCHFAITHNAYGTIRVLQNIIFYCHWHYGRTSCPRYFGEFSQDSKEFHRNPFVVSEKFSEVTWTAIRVCHNFFSSSVLLNYRHYHSHNIKYFLLISRTMSEYPTH